MTTYVKILEEKSQEARDLVAPIERVVLKELSAALKD